MRLLDSIHRAFDRENPWVRILARHGWRDAWAPMAIVGFVTVGLAIRRAFLGVESNTNIRLLCLHTVILMALSATFCLWLAHRKIRLSPLTADLQMVPDGHWSQEWALRGQALRAGAVMALVTALCCVVTIALLWARLSEAEVWSDGSGFLYWRIDGWGWGSPDGVSWPPGPLSSPVPLCVSVTVATSVLAVGTIAGFLFWALAWAPLPGMDDFAVACSVSFLAFVVMLGRLIFLAYLEIVGCGESHLWGVVFRGSQEWDHKMHLGIVGTVVIAELALIGIRALLLLLLTAIAKRKRAPIG